MMKNTIENMATKYHAQVVWFSLALAFLAIALLSFGGADYLATKVKYDGWKFLPLFILAFYVFFVPFIAPLLDYSLSESKSEFKLTKVVKRVVPKSKAFVMMTMSWIVALVMLHGAYNVYEMNSTVRLLEQKVCMLKKNIYAPGSSVSSCFNIVL